LRAYPNVVAVFGQRWIDEPERARAALVRIPGFLRAT
jgi:hypothetical protein